MIEVVSTISIFIIFSIVVFFMGKFKAGKLSLALVSMIPYAYSYMILPMLWFGMVSSKEKLFTGDFLGIKGFFAVDPFSLFYSGVTALAANMLILHIISRFGDREIAPIVSSALFTTGAVLGTLFSHNILAIFMFWEMTLAGVVGLSLCPCGGYRKQTHEAMMKMVVMTSISSAFLIAGIGLLIASISGPNFDLPSLNLLSVWEKIPEAKNVQLLVMSFVLIAVALLTDAGAVPFYMWLPDYVSGIVAPPVALMLVTSDLAAYYLLGRFMTIFSHLFQTVKLTQLAIITLIATIGIFSIVLGELSALSQGKVRRLFGYSMVSDAGYSLLLIILYNVNGVFLFGDNAYMAMPYAYFTAASSIAIAVIMAILGSFEDIGVFRLQQLQGMHIRLPFSTILLSISLLSMAGIPPLAGFVAKYLLIFSLVATNMPIFLVAAFIASLFFVVCAAYSFRLIKISFSPREDVSRLEERKSDLIPLAILVLTLILAGITPTPFLWTFGR